MGKLLLQQSADQYAALQQPTNHSNLSLSNQSPDDDPLWPKEQINNSWDGHQFYFIGTNQKNTESF